MHDRRPSLCIWRAEAAWALAICDCDDLAWALTREWVLSIDAAKTSTWALTRKWALARDTMVCMYVVMLEKCRSLYLCVYDG